MDGVISKSIVKNGETLSYRYQVLAKRLLDILISGIGLIVLSPIIVIIAIAIRIDSQGPVIYKHKRIGKDAKSFELYKFRSMISGGDDSSYMDYLKELIESSKTNVKKPYRKLETDPRVTRVGHIIRKLYLDELPQLWNILIGEMSLVGPRPHVQFEVDYYTDDEYRRLSVKPGATGIWQVHGKKDCSFQELIELDLDYVDHWNLGMDLKLIWQTIIIVISGGEGSWTRMAKVIPGDNSLLAPGETNNPVISNKG